MNIKAIFLISIMAFSFLAISFDNVSAGTGNVILKPGYIHMDADNGKTAYLWGYK